MMEMRAARETEADEHGHEERAGYKHTDGTALGGRTVEHGSAVEPGKLSVRINAPWIEGGTAAALNVFHASTPRRQCFTVHLRGNPV